jgi:hypothetical protein
MAHLPDFVREVSREPRHFMRLFGRELVAASQARERYAGDD